MNRRIKFAAFSSLLTALLAGCSATGPKFQSFERSEVDRDKSIVFFYRPDKFIAGGRTLHVMQVDRLVDDKTGEFVKKEIVNKWRLYNNSYYKAVLPPGIYPLTTNWLFDTEDFAFSANEVICVKLDVTASSLITSHPDLVVVDTKTCESEISQTQLMTEEDQKEHYLK